jgi:hypothetical protein
MMGRNLLVGLFAIVAYGASDCLPPPNALASLKDYLAYSADRRGDRPSVELFSFATADGDALFLQHEVPRYFDKTQRFVYVFREGHPLFQTSCPADPKWRECAEKSFRDLMPAAAGDDEARTAGSSCDLSVMIPKWHPSADSPLKRKLASEVLQELMRFGWEHPKEVYVRDFNIHDPDLDFYIIDAEGKENIQGCWFDASRLPHCQWHMYGQSPFESLKREIMDRPYRLVPASGQ